MAEISLSTKVKYEFVDLLQEVEDAGSQLQNGFQQSPRSIAPKFFYDEAGSELFTAITRTQEYYPTRTEIGLLQQHGKEIAECIGSDATLLEYGSGSSEKIRTLLENLRPERYVPMDISREYLASSAQTLADDYDWLDVLAICVDYTKPFALPRTFEGHVAAFFPGSSIGNFSPDAALTFLSRVKQHVGEGGLLIGVDLKKDIGVLNNAYNDGEGLTAQFNLNVLSHINTEYGGNFDLTKFSHRAFYNEQLGCIQMFIDSRVDQHVTVADKRFALQAGEEIHTENSFKYSEAEFRALAREAGFTKDRFWTDPDNWFGVFYLN